jgi:hypothetical protein
VDLKIFMNLKLSQVSPSHEQCFGFTDQYPIILGTSNIAGVELGGSGEEISNIESYDWRNLAAIFGANAYIILPRVLKHAVERDRLLHQYYGLPDVNPVYFDVQHGFNEDIRRVLQTTDLNLSDGYIMTFEDNHGFIRMAQEMGLSTSNRSADIVQKLNDKVEMLTTGVFKTYGEITIPYGFEVRSTEELSKALVQLSNNMRFVDSFVSIKSAFSASGQGIKKGRLNDLLSDLEDPDSKLNEWLKFNKSKGGQRFMVQEYYSSDRYANSPAFQFSVSDSGSELLAVSRQILVDGVHGGNMFDPEILEKSPQLRESVSAVMDFVYSSGFRGIIGADMLEIHNESGEKEYAFMEFNARWTGAVTPLLFASAITQRPATDLFFSSDNTFKTGKKSFEELIEVISSPQFDPMNDGKGVVLVSSAPMMTKSDEDAKAQLLFMGDSAEDVVEITNNFTSTLRGL